MKKICFGDNTTADEVRRQLSDFSRLSDVEASTEKVDGKKIVVLHEVTLGQRFFRLFQSPERRSEAADESRRAIRALVNTHPAMAALLGSSNNLKSGWSVTELREALNVGLVRLASSEHGKKLAVQLSEKGQVGVANARVEDIESDSKVSWSIRPPSGIQSAFVVEPGGGRQFAEVKVSYPAEPGIEEMRHAYREALKAASGHVVIAPIKDGIAGVSLTCSDLSLDLLLEAIEEAKKNNPELTAVTIAVRELGDKTLAGRIEDLHAQRNSYEANSKKSKELGKFHPPHGRQVPGRAGIHFLTNSPFDLQAGRIILPDSVAESKGYEYFPEMLVTELPKFDTGRLIALDDSRLDRHAGGSPENIQQRFGRILANMVGTVVIYPPSCDDDQLEAMMSAVLDACDKNPQLSVSFSAPDERQQAQLIRAYRNAKEHSRENTLESDDEDDTEIPVADLWQTV